MTFVPVNKIIWTEERLAYIRDNWDKMTNKQLAEKMGLRVTSVRTQCYAMGLYKLELEYWTDDQVAFLKDNYQEIGDVEIAEIFNAEFPKKKGWTKKHIEKKRRYLQLKRTPEQIKAIHRRNTEKGRFSVSHWKRWIDRVSPVGTLRTWRYENGNQFIAIRLKDGFVHYAPWLYKQVFGPVPEGCVIRMRDNNSLNVTVANLEAVTRVEHAKRNAAVSRDILSDKYIAGILTHGQPEIRQEMLQDKELLAFKRAQLQLNRVINKKAKQYGEK